VPRKPPWDSLASRLDCRTAALRSVVAEHDYEVSCECGAQWRVRLEYDDDAMATCLACGADTFELVDIGEVHSGGSDVEF
jgi:hypothetical protein